MTLEREIETYNTKLEQRREEKPNIAKMKEMIEGLIDLEARVNTSRDRVKTEKVMVLTSTY